MELLLNLLAAAVGAAIAGFLGVRFGVQQLQRERAFDRRLTWYQAAIVKTQELRLACLASAYGLEHGLGEPERSRRIQTFHDAHAAWLSAAAAASIYASATTAEEIHAAVDRVGSLLEPVPSGTSVDLPVAQLQLVAVALATLLERLNAEARHHLWAE